MKRILIIEDEDSLRQGITEILTFEGYETLEAEDGIQGVRIAFEQLPDLILCDIMMPEMDGHEVLTLIGANEETRDIPFIFITALGEKADIRDGMNRGADDYIPKPFSSRQLLDAVTTRLDKSAAHERKAEAALNELRAAIITRIPHELLKPLTGIVSAADIIARQAGTLNTGQLQRLGCIIQRSGVRLRRQIEHYLLYIDLSTNEVSRDTAPPLLHTGVRIKSAATEIAMRHRRSDDLLLKNVDVTCRICENDFDVLLTEILDNAFKFSEPLSPVTVRCACAGKVAEIVVHNFGRVFPRDGTAHIGAFTQFGRDQYDQQGSGLGLVIAKMLVERARGSLHVESDAARGTTVSLRLPCE